MRTPLTPEEEARRRSLNKKILGFGCLPITALLVIVIAVTASSGDDSKASSEPTAKVPAYTALNKKEKTHIGSVDLLIPDVTVEQAKAAIHDYAQRIDGQRDYGITVIRSKDAGTYVCRAEWVKDEQAAQLYTGGRIKSDSWPTIDMNCPDPASS